MLQRKYECEPEEDLHGTQRIWLALTAVFLFQIKTVLTCNLKMPLETLKLRLLF